MAKKKLPLDAFEYYFSLGQDRSYRNVAEHFGVSKTAVGNLAEKENWQKRVTDLEKKVHNAVEQKITETLEQMSERHIRMCKLIQKKALETLKTMPLTTAIEAVRALDSSIKQERLIRGEPTDRSAVSIEDVIRQEYERWMTTVNVESDENLENRERDDNEQTIDEAAE